MGRMVGIPLGRAAALAAGPGSRHERSHYPALMPAADPCLLVILGASGDLTARKLVPALYEQHLAGTLPPQTRVLGVSRRPKRDDEWREELAAAVRTHLPAFDPSRWAELAPRISYLAADAADASAWPAIASRCREAAPGGECGNLLFFLAVAPELYAPMIAAIGGSGLVPRERRACLDAEGPGAVGWRRVIVEKPFGVDYASAVDLNRRLAAVFEEREIYRIDHYLAKDQVQGLLALRFANAIFEPLWNERFVDHVQITAAEALGVEDRVGFYDQTGAIRDMIQSHLLQVLALVAMEPPSLYAADRIRSERTKILESIQPPPPDRLGEFAALGQYAAGGGLPGYAESPGVAAGSLTETFAAMKVRFDNWRWAGTPFYLRSGKRLAAKRTEVVVQFKPPAANLFRSLAGDDAARFGTADRLVVEIAPGRQLRLRILARVPGSSFSLSDFEMAADFGERFGAREPEAYGPLLLDAMRGDQSLFKDREEVEAAWSAVEPLIGDSSRTLRLGIAGNYEPGSWGPASSAALLARDGRRWHDFDPVGGT
jgi:glucose-6-phosphate 1-dehydrogenase